jgi:hypothetical protein
MSIKWKKRFKPAEILSRFDSARIVSPSEEKSFTGFGLIEYIPVLQSMLEFPPVTADFDISDLVWRALNEAGEELTPSSFLITINKILSSNIATREEDYCLLTAISLDSRDIPQKLRILDAEIHIQEKNYPPRFKSREEILLESPTLISPTPANYCKLEIKVKAKSPDGAVNKALRGLNLQRSLWCLMANPRLEIASGTARYSPINVVRLGGEHTLHFATGSPVTNGIWFDPGFVEAKIRRLSKPDIIKRNSRWMLRQIADCSYGESLISALIQFVRALDERNANAAFLGLWSAIEVLTTPGQANYDNLVNRCSFIFKEKEYHKQILEHLREYRNASVHFGEESDNARIHCFQLQLYFVSLIRFHLHNAKYFDSLKEANSFLDSPSDHKTLNRQLSLIRKVLRFTK